MYIGIDPGKKTGITVIGYPKSASVTLDMDKVCADVEDWQRISDFAAKIVMKVDHLAGPPDRKNKWVVGIENNHFGMNGQAALKQRELIGAIRAYLCMQSQVREIVGVSPKEAKKALTGYGGAEKSERTTDADGKEWPSMVEAAKGRFTRDWADRFKYEREAEADALGVALAAKKIHQEGE